jgi:phage terminase large subunit GpA-like protein
MGNVVPKLAPIGVMHADVDARVLDLAAPPELEPPSAWADQHCVRSSEASAAPGEWHTLPFQKEPLDCLVPHRLLRAPLFRDMPILKGKVADSKAKSGGAMMFHRRFVGGHLTLMGSNSAARLASRPIR